MGPGRLSPGDPNSHSRPDEVAVHDIALSWEVDFDKHVLKGKVTLKAVRHKDGIDKLILDSNNITIFEVIDEETGKKLEYTLHEPVQNFGSKLEITLPDAVSPSYTVAIAYQTSNSASALQWLPPEQTAGKTHPYLFSQCQAIHCRSIIPCQDTPSAKVTYSAEVKAPSDLVVLMSAMRQGEAEEHSNGLRSHKFLQKVPVPSYLVAIAVGALKSRKIGPRSTVWSEQEFIEESANEFIETETMLSTAESICGTYIWGVYDLLVLPPSFPYGGMENPCITFVTPTLLAGDRSLATIVAHEIAHSWTGNLVTNYNFEHFWLNEGFTVFVERKIIGKMNGEEARLFAAYRGLKDLNDTLSSRGEDDPLTKLVVDLTNISPDDSFSVVPYEKGHTFLFYLEQLVGGPEKFDPFLKSYFQDYKFKSLYTEEFKKYLYDHFPDNEALKNVDWDSWLHTPGKPPTIPNYETNLNKACQELATKWVEWSGDTAHPFSQEDLKSLSAVQVQEFLSLLLLEKPFTVSKLEAMEAAYNFNKVRNTEIHFRWLRLCIRGKWSEQIPLVLKFVTEQGRMKYIRPLYRELYDWEDARPKALETFHANKATMMYVASYVVAKDLHTEV